MTTSYAVDTNNCAQIHRNENTGFLPSIRNVIFELKCQLSTFLYHVKRRRKFVALLNYDDRMLDDMGLARYAIEEASKLPLKADAARIARSLT